MKKTGKKLLAIATAVSLAALALSGCGGGSAAPSSAAQPSETKKEEAQKQAEAAGAESSAGDADYTQGDPIVIKIAHVSQEGVPIDLASNKLGEMLKEKTGGRITVDVFPASALGNNTDSGNGNFLRGISWGIYGFHCSFGPSVFIPVQ